MEKTLVIDDFEKIYNAGLRNYEDEFYYDAIIYFKAAIKMEESIDLLYKLGECLYYMGRYDDAIEVFNKIISKEGEKIDSLLFLIHCHDLNRDKEKTIEYANRLINFPTESEYDIENKIFIYHVLFDIYLYENKFEEAEQVKDDLEIYLNKVTDYSKEHMESTIRNMKDILEYSR